MLHTEIYFFHHSWSSESRITFDFRFQPTFYCCHVRWSSIHLNKRNIWNFVGCSLYYISIHEFGLNVTFLSGNSQQVPKVVFFLSNYWRDCVLIIDELVKHTIYQTLLILKELSEFKKFCFCPLCLCQFFGCWYWWQFCVSRQIGNSHLCRESCQHLYDR